MQVGRVTERIQVAGQAPTVQLATSSISAVVNSTTVRELPLNGRSWTDLATLQPGVEAIQTQQPFTAGDTRGKRGYGAQVTISGARPEQNDYRLDGISLNDYANGAPGSVLGGNLGVDAIEEFSVLTSNYSAEFAAYVEHQPKRNYVLEWNLNVQHEFTPNLTAMVGYVGSRGVHQPSHVDDMDIVVPALTAQGYLWPSPVGSGTTINPNFSTVRGQVWAGNSFFHALELQLTKRMSRGLQLQGSYTW